MTRLSNWTTRFAEFIKVRKNLPFAWGTNDCTTFVCDALIALTGTDYAPKELRAVRSAKEALRAIQLLSDNQTLLQAVEKVLGAPKSPGFGAVGDVVAFLTLGEVTLGICNGDTILCVTPNGIMTISMSEATHVWKV